MSLLALQAGYYFFKITLHYISIPINFQQTLALKDVLKGNTMCIDTTMIVGIALH